jgi:hypothetical protein
MRRTIVIWFFALISTVTLAGCVAVVRAHPPPARVEVRPAMPYPDAVWIGGYWQRQHNDWIWIGGRWARKPWPDAQWEPGFWTEKRGGWEWKPGHWRREAGNGRHERRKK